MPEARHRATGGLVSLASNSDMTPLRVCFIVAVTASVLSACAPIQPRITSTLSTIIRGDTPNFDARRPNLVVIHHTSDATVEEALHTLTSPASKVSAHYLIGRDGSIIQLVEENARAWHAGLSWWGGVTDVNSISLGIELDNDGFEPFAAPQIDALLLLLADIRQRHHIPAANFIGHADVAPTRKSDPSAFFPWDKLATQGFGLWCDSPVQPAPAGFDLPLALAALGYDPRTPEASRQAFQLHFLNGERLSPLNSLSTAAEEQAMAFCLLQLKRSMQP
jgi:N-acetylmuramoyl-L-alanine amidase